MRKDDMKQIVLGAAGSVLVILAIAIWNSIASGGLVRVLGGVSEAQFGEKLDKAIEVMETKLQELPIEQPEIAGLLANGVILTDQECKVFGPNWKRYEKMDGRFPLGAGQTEDTEREHRTFTVGQAGGAYRHKLTEPEMPEHAHWFHGSRGDRVVDDWDNERGHRDQRRKTEETGGGEPHNNVPPYFVVNFCHLAEETQTD